MFNALSLYYIDKNRISFISIFIGAFVFIAMLFTKQTLANSDDPILLTIDVSFIEVHSGPSVGYPIVNIVEKGEQITVLLKRTSWLKIRDKRGNEGWLRETDLSGLSQQGEKLSSTEISIEDFKSRSLETGIMYGDFSGSNYYQLSLGYSFSKVFSTELSLGKALGDISNSDTYDFMFIGQPFPDLIVIPYVGIGGGVINTTPHSVLADSEERQNTYMSSSFGIKYHLARNFLIRAEYKYSLVLTDRNNNEEVQTWALGFSVFF